MPIDRDVLLALWELEDLPACGVGMELAKIYLEVCGAGVNRLGIEEPADRITEISAAYAALVEHGLDCDNCNEVADGAYEVRPVEPARTGRNVARKGARILRMPRV
jgi:hypothetical protein